MLTVVRVWSLSCVQLLHPHGLWPSSLVCPWDFPGKNTGMGLCLWSRQIGMLLVPQAMTIFVEGGEDQKKRIAF